jgi:hypothetical protein
MKQVSETDQTKSESKTTSQTIRRLSHSPTGVAVRSGAISR